MRKLYLLLLMAIGCEPVGQSVSRGAIVNDVGPNVVISIENRPLRVREVLRTSVPKGGVPFTRIVDIDVAPTGDMFVLDAGNYAVQAVRADGTAAATWGRRGQGPGEFSRPALLTISGDTVFVLDTYLHAFSLSGDLYYSQIPDNPRPRVAVPSDLVSVEGVLVLVERDSDDQAGDDTKLEEWWAVRRRDIGSRRFAKPTFTLPALTTYQRGQVYYREVFGAVPAFALSPSGAIVYSSGRQYMLDVFKHDGTLSRRLSADVHPVEVSRADWSKKIDQMSGGPANDHGESSPRPSVRTLRSLPHAASRPLIGKVLVNANDEIALERLDRATDASSHWDLVSVAGDYIGYIRIPSDFSPLALGSKAIYGLSRSRMDEQILIVYAIERG